jgi:hypothetical protein
MGENSPNLVTLLSSSARIGSQASGQKNKQRLTGTHMYVVISDKAFKVEVQNVERQNVKKMKMSNSYEP